MKRFLVPISLALLIFFCSIPVSAGDTNLARVKAKNVIVMIGDGMGFNTLYSASVYSTGKKTGFSWQNSGYSAAVCTFARGGSYDEHAMWADPDYCMSGATDSAAAATALSSGMKTFAGAVGVDYQGRPIENILERAESLGMSTGVVTSVQISHATPAAFVAHNTSRGNYEQIALEMFESGVDVIMGAGHPYYDDNGVRQGSAISFKYVGGKNGWTSLNNGKYGKFISARGDFKKYMKGRAPDRLIGIAQVHQTLQQRRSSVLNAGPAAEKAPFQTPQNSNVPSLKEMTSAALNVLDNNENGFVLMVEGGAIDWAGHGNQTARSIEETLQFNEAIEAVRRWIKKNSSWDDTLLIITADHETGYLFSEGAASSRVVPGSGKGSGMPDVEWKSGGHTNQLVPLYIEGAAGKKLAGRAKSRDPVRGKYMDNTQIARYIFKLLK